MKIMLRLDRTLEQNASMYFDKAKKDKKKLAGAIEALEKSKKKLAKVDSIEPDIPETKAKARKKEWYEKFRWFYTSEDFLVIGGRDATTNEIIIKKHTEKDDLVFHTDMAGSPFFVIKAGGREIGEASINETADATASYSRGWKKGLAENSVFYVAPDQVTKQAKSGESLAKGAFMIYGKTTYAKNRMRIAIGYDGKRIIGGPVNSVKKHSEKAFEIVQGQKKASDIAKHIQKELGGSLDEIISFLPPGGCKIA